MWEIRGVVLITGANGGIGSGIVRSLLERGYRNIACVYNQEFRKISQILEEKNVDIDTHLFQSDLCDEQSVRKLRQNVEGNLGQVENIVNLAGGSINGMGWKIPLSDFKKVLEINYISTVACCKEFIPAMREKNYGRIVNASSTGAFRGIAGASPYTAAKAAIVGFSKTLSLELARNKITVNTVAIGYCDTGLIVQIPDATKKEILEATPLHRFGNSNDIAHCINYLLSEESEFITGQVHHVNGGIF